MAVGTGAAILGSTAASILLGQQATNAQADAAGAAADATLQGTLAQIGAQQQGLASQLGIYDIANQQARQDAAAGMGIGRESLYSIADILGINVTNPYGSATDIQSQIDALQGGINQATQQEGQRAGLEQQLADLNAQIEAQQGSSGMVLGMDIGTPIDQSIIDQRASIEAQLAGLPAPGATDPLADYANTEDEQLALLQERLALAQQFEGRTPYEFETSPEYQFQLEQGEQALARRQAAGGTRLGGGAAREALRYSQGLASQERGNTIERLFRLAGYGGAPTNTAGASAGAIGTATQGIAGAYGQQGANLANIYQNLGQSQAAGYGYLNQSLQGGMSNLAMLQGYNNMLNNQSWNQNAWQGPLPGNY